ncbi:hypothetical protein HPG69_010268, partial [Diceros bicornis minor]
MATPRRFPTLVQLERREGTLFEVLGNLTKQPYWFHFEYLKSPKAVHLEAWLVEAIFGAWAGEGQPMWPPSYSSRRLATYPGKPVLCPWPQPRPLPAPTSSRRPPLPSPPPRGLFVSCAGPGGEHIPHVEWVSQTLLHVNQWDPEGEAEILIFGRPDHQKDVSKMIMNLADYHRHLRAPSTGREEGGGPRAGPSSKKAVVQEAGNQRPPDAVRDAATQPSPGA